MTRRPNDIQGAGARRAALRLLDAVLRRGETLDQAAGAATAGLLTSSDGALARAIAGEVLRWLADLDALIDSATRTNLADDGRRLGDRGRERFLDQHRYAAAHEREQIARRPEVVVIT